MHRSSESIATLAAALAKAQTALVNPEKTMAATIRTGRAGEGPERSFRYAPLSSGLDIVRRALGQQEIAVMQTTSLDENARLLRLNTVLAHSSGEWIASDWPVCPLSDVSTPQRMGAALTYARRYGLFALVGIAGEDDLDAPDLHDEPVGSAAGSTGAPTSRPHHGNGAAVGRQDRSRAASARSLLCENESSRRRDELIAEIAGLADSDQALAWALRALPEKNRLRAEDATAVEASFSERTQALIGSATDHADLNGSEQIVAVPDELALDAANSPTSSALALAAEPVPAVEPVQQPAVADVKNERDSSPPSGRGREDFPQRLPTLPPSITKTSRRRDAEHLRFVAAQPCLICARQPSDPHHLRFAQARALGRKASDEFTVPLCRTHHRQAHRSTNERAWWNRLGIMPLEIARKLWQQSHGNTASDKPTSRNHSGQGNASSPPRRS
jgi:hypothetical protein